MKIILSLLALAAFAFPLVAQQNPFPKTITVSGSAEMEIVPDEIYVLVELKEYDKKGAGKIGLESIKADFLNQCKKAGLADSVISIAAYEGDSPSSYYYYWEKRGKKDDLYSSISYQVKFSDSKTMDALVTLLDDNATKKFQVIRTWHSKIMEYRKQLKIQAIKAAREKANYMAEAINEKAVEAVSINELENHNYWGNLAFANSAISQSNYRDESVNNSAGVDFKKMKLRFEVTAVFALK